MRTIDPRKHQTHDDKWWRQRDDSQAGQHHDDGRGRIGWENPGSVVDGKTIAQWTQDWLKWVYDRPAGTEPWTSPENAQNPNDGRIFFLAGGPWPSETFPQVPTIDVPADKHILLPMINAWDVEGPNIATLKNPSGDWAQDAKAVTDLGLKSIYEAHVTVTPASGGKPLLDLEWNAMGCWPSSSNFAEKSDIFALGHPEPGSALEAFVGAGNAKPPIYDLPYSRIVGYWLMLDGLSPGDYKIDFGGHGHAVLDPTVTPGSPPAYLFGSADGGWSSSTTEILHVTAKCG